MPFLVFLWAILPIPKSRIAYASGYAAFYYNLKKKVVVWHKQELESMDSDYAMHQAQIKLMKAREGARAKGIGPLDPRYPSISDFHPLTRS